MSLLITGGTGFIGSHTVVELLALDKDIIIVDNLANSSILVLDLIFVIELRCNKYSPNMTLMR